MKVIHKYAIPVKEGNEVLVKLPAGAELLDVQVQREQPVLWALVDPEAEVIDIQFLWLATGMGFPPETEQKLDYLGTFQFHSGEVVFHLFVVQSEQATVNPSLNNTIAQA